MYTETLQLYHLDLDNGLVRAVAADVFMQKSATKETTSMHGALLWTFQWTGVMSRVFGIKNMAWYFWAHDTTKMAWERTEKKGKLSKYQSIKQFLLSESPIQSPSPEGMQNNACCVAADHHWVYNPTSTIGKVAMQNSNAVRRCISRLQMAL